MEKIQIELIKEENDDLKLRVKELEQLVMDITAPIIPSILPETILVPITGKLLPERFEKITTKLLCYSASQDINTIVIDFSAISEKEIGEIEVFGHHIDNLTSALNLVGVQVLYAGFTPNITKELITSGLSTNNELSTFLSFKKALQYLMKQKGLQLVKE